MQFQNQDAPCSAALQVRIAVHKGDGRMLTWQSLGRRVLLESDGVAHPGIGHGLDAG